MENHTPIKPHRETTNKTERATESEVTILDSAIKAGLQRQSDTYSSRLDGQHRDIWIIAAKTSIDSQQPKKTNPLHRDKDSRSFFNTWQNIKSSRLWNLQDDYFQIAMLEREVSRR
jgi:hypothetical protein